MVRKDKNIETVNRIFGFLLFRARGNVLFFMLTYFVSFLVTGFNMKLSQFFGCVR